MLFLFLETSQGIKDRILDIALPEKEDLGMLDKRVLKDGTSVVVLDAGYEFVGVVSWQRAMTLLFTGKIEVVKYSERVIRTVSNEYVIPAVARLVRAVKRVYKTAVAWSRRNLFLRDNYECAYCGTRSFTGMTVDHIHAVSKGGKTTWENTVCCCKPCNDKKGDALPEQAGLKLRKNPKRPSIKDFCSVILKNRLGVSSIDDLFA
jgi:5-methylcytosine-specific restriction endonuclease McrA